MHALRFERLEDRTLLSANATLNGGTLVIDGDGGDDDVRISGTGNLNEVEVIINGNLEGTFQAENIDVELRGGEDRLAFRSIQILGDVDVNMGNGEDLVIVNTLGPVNNDVIIGGDLHVQTGVDSGDEIRLTTQTTAEGYSINVGGNADLRGAELFTLDGDDADGNGSDFGSAEINVLGRLDIKSRVFGAHVDMDDVTVRDQTYIELKNGDNLVDLSDSNFHGDFRADLGNGNDRLDFDDGDGPSEFQAGVEVRGQGGFDTIEDANTAIFAESPNFRSIENYESNPAG